MRILVIGGGGREHALAWKLSQEATVFCSPGNAGIAEDVACVGAMSVQETVQFVQENEIDLVVFGPEDPLVLGRGNELRSHGIRVFGPDQAAAQLEGSKAFSKEIMEAAGVPTAKSFTESDSERAKDACRTMFAEGRQVAVKASGNALGKGVIVCSTLEEALGAVDALKALGSAGDTLVIEERLFGYEFSLLTLVSEGDIFSLPVAQDYKRVGTGNEGPNTGGMGTYSPVSLVTAEVVKAVEESVVRPAIAELSQRGIGYRGVLFSGIMMTDDGPKCLEYNVRFGDPETQTVMRRLGSGLAEALMCVACGEPIRPVEVLDNAVTTVVLASGGYPGEYAKGKPIIIGDIGKTGSGGNVKVFHAGTVLKDGQLVTNGGRVLGVSAVGATVKESTQLAYDAIDSISFEGMHFRTDIGA